MTNGSLTGLIRLLRSKRGFTLLETITAMSVTTLLLLGVAMVMPGLTKAQLNSAQSSRIMTMAAAIEEALRNELSFANYVELDGDDLVYTGNYGEKTLTTQNPVIEGLTYDEKFYMGFDVSFDYSIDGSVDAPPLLITADMSVSDAEGVRYTDKYVIRVHGK